MHVALVKRTHFDVFMPLRFSKPQTIFAWRHASFASKKTAYGIKPNKSGGGDNNTYHNITFNHHADALFYNSLLFFLPPVFCKGCIRKVIQGERKEQHKRQGCFGDESTLPAAHAWLAW
jgi:hypothetical protein